MMPQSWHHSARRIIAQRHRWRFEEVDVTPPSGVELRGWPVSHPPYRGTIMSDLFETEIEIVEEPRSKGRQWGTIFGRVLMVVLLIILAIEAHAKLGYDRTLTALRTNASTIAGEQVKGKAQELEEWSLPIADAEKCVRGFPSQSRETQFQFPVVVLRWFSLFKTYVIRLHMDDQNNVMSLSTDEAE